MVGLIIIITGHAGTSFATVQGRTSGLDDNISLHPGKQEIFNPPFIK